MHCHRYSGDWVSELRIHHGAGLRLYFTVRRRVMVFMLVGSTKPTQVRLAKLIERSFRERAMAVETTAFDPDKYFKTPATQAALLSDAMASGNAGLIADAIGIIARNHGMGELAKQTGLNRQGLYAALSADGNPTLETLLKVLAALNLELSVREIEGGSLFHTASP